ncbi:MAG TPA: hypothetical protein VID27_15735, partial [Blastocatellia bacterium]
ALQLLKAQVSALAEILYGKNLLTIEDINRLIDSNSELLPVKTLLTLILEALVKKEIFSKEEAEEILKPS